MVISTKFLALGFVNISPCCAFLSRWGKRRTGQSRLTLLEYLFKLLTVKIFIINDNFSNKAVNFESFKRV